MLSAALLASLATLTPASLSAQSDTTPAPHIPRTYSITLVTSDTGSHLLGEVETGWRLQSVRPVELVHPGRGSVKSRSVQYARF